MGLPKGKRYSKRTYPDKIAANWNKTLQLFEKGEFSLAILRSHTTVELAATFAVTQELAVAHSLPSGFVDSLLIWANGIKGKFLNLLLKITTGPKKQRMNSIWDSMKYLNDQRNSVAHSGQFKKRATAEKCLGIARQSILSLVSEYDKVFWLPEVPGDQPTTASR